MHSFNLFTGNTYLILSEAAIAEFSLIEKSISQIKASQVHDFQDLIYDHENTLDMFKLLYETEYKYNLLLTFPFTGMDRRRRNVMSILEEVGQKVTGVLAEAFEVVFEEWLSAHAITRPEQWAKARLNDLFEEYDYTMLIELIVSELGRYLGHNSVVYDYLLEMFQNVVDGKLDGMPEIETFVETFGYNVMIESMEIDLEEVSNGYMDIEEWNEIYGLDAEDVDDAYDLIQTVNKDRFWETHEVADVYPFNEGLGALAQAVEGYFDQQGSHRAYDFFIELEQHFVFPVWFGHWEKQGIVKTRQTIEDIYRTLQEIDRLSIEKRFMIINLAKNASHQTGSMMEYFEDRFGVGEQEMKELSNTDTSEWDDELEKLGVVF